MDIKLLLKSLVAVGLCSCTPCEDDLYGEELILIVPITTSPFKDSIALGDTIWINVNLDKDVKISDSGNTIRLDSFNFFTELFISECSGVEENYYTPVDTIVRNGKLDYLPLSTALSYPVIYEENSDHYNFVVGIVPRERGLYWIGLASSRDVLEHYDHPVMYICDGNKRDDVRIQYSNSSTNLSNFESMFKRNQVSYLQNVDYDDFASVGSIAILIY